MKKLFLLIILFFITGFPLIAQDKIIEVLNKELMRNWDVLKNEKTPAYFISYRVNDVKTYSIKSSFGEILSNEEDRNAKIAVDVRVGSYKLDNTHFNKQGRDFEFDFPYDGETDGFAQSAWLKTSTVYKQACDLYAKVQSGIAVKNESDDKSDDFSIEEPVVYYEKPIDESKIEFDTKKWQGKLNKYSSVFLECKDILEGNVSLNYRIERKYFVSTEGSKITENDVTCRLYIHGMIQADDGMELPLNESFFAFEPNQMPHDTVITNAVKRIVTILKQMKTAPVADAYTGPALLSPSTAGVFFHEIFGHRIEGQKMKSDNDAQTFKNKVGQKVLNENLSVIFNPTITEYKGFKLSGSYKYDEQGIKGSKVVIIENGILKNFLLSRTPIAGFSKSNGHARAQAGVLATSRQSNMIVETNKPYSEAELREMLKAEAKKQGKEYGYYFVNTDGGFTYTGREIPNAFNVTPIEVYRVYVDGRPDELIRGVDLVGTPLSVFSNIEAAGDINDIFTGYCGASSGRVPTSTICPMIFVKQIETQSKMNTKSKRPILPRP